MRQLQHRNAILKNFADSAHRPKPKKPTRQKLCLVEPMLSMLPIPVEKERINAMTKNRVLDFEEERFLFRNYESAIALRDKKTVSLITSIVVCANQGLVHLIAREFHLHKGAAVDYNDLMQAGNIGLLFAIKKFDYKRGNKFSTYASWWVSACIWRELKIQFNLPQNALSSLMKIIKFKRVSEASGSGNPTTQEISEATNTSVAMVNNLGSFGPFLSLDAAPLGDGDVCALIKKIKDANAADQSEYTEHNEVMHLLARVIGSLQPRESAVIRRRFGIGQANSESLGDIAVTMKITRQRVSQIETQAMKKLQRLLEPMYKDGAL